MIKIQSELNKKDYKIYDKVFIGEVIKWGLILGSIFLGHSLISLFLQNYDEVLIGIIATLIYTIPMSLIIIIKKISSYIWFYKNPNPFIFNFEFYKDYFIVNANGNMNKISYTSINKIYDLDDYIIYIIKGKKLFIVNKRNFEKKEDYDELISIFKTTYSYKIKSNKIFSFRRKI